MELNKYSKYIDQLSFNYQSCVNLSGESNGFFFLSKDVINYCYHAMGNMWQCKARLRYEENRRALGTKDMITFFFSSLYHHRSSEF